MRAMVAAMLLTAVLAGCASVPLLPPEQLVIQKVVDAPNVSKDQIFEKTKIWFAKNFRQSMAGWWEQNSTRTVIQYENRDKGLLIANGAILYPMENLTESYKYGWEVRFTLQAEVKDGTARITFSNLDMFVPTIICGSLYPQTMSSYEKPLDAEEFALVKPVFLGLADQFGAYLMSPEKNWYPDEGADATRSAPK